MSDWYSGQPNNAVGGEDNAVMMTSNSKWYDVSADYETHTVCEKPGTCLISTGDLSVCMEFDYVTKSIDILMIKKFV